MTDEEILNLRPGSVIATSDGVYVIIHKEPATKKYQLGRYVIIINVSEISDYYIAGYAQGGEFRKTTILLAL